MYHFVTISATVLLQFTKPVFQIFKELAKETTAVTEDLRRFNISFLLITDMPILSRHLNYYIIMLILVGRYNRTSLKTSLYHDSLFSGPNTDLVSVLPLIPKA